MGDNGLADLIGLMILPFLALVGAGVVLGLVLSAALSLVGWLWSRLFGGD